MRMDGPFTATASGLGIRVHARPGARRDAVEGLRAEADGSVALRVAVRAAPQDGRANAAIAKLLAAEWDVPKARLRLASGAAVPRKLFVIEGEPTALRARLQGWLKRWTTERQ